MKVSWTARLVAAARAVASDDARLGKVCSDPIAAAVLRRRQQPAPLAPGWVRKGASAMSLGFVEHMALRTAIIDEVVRDQVPDRAKQVVVLGAGLDSRAHRMAELTQATVYEVDLPAMQSYKRERIRSFAHLTRALVYVPSDFDGARWVDALLHAGFRSREPTCWICEGVSMYMTPTVFAQTAQDIDSLSAPRSLVALTYVTPQLGARSRWVGRMAAWAFRIGGEPIRCVLTPDEMNASWRRMGWECASDELPTEASARFGLDPARFALAIPDERVFVGVKGDDALAPPGGVRRA